MSYHALYAIKERQSTRIWLQKLPKLQVKGISRVLTWPMTQKTAFPHFLELTQKSRHCGGGSGVHRGDRIRTCDIQLPKLALYQAELRPERFRIG